jgi:hypothetical protein
MSKQAAEHHHQAAEHHDHAARHHREAAKHHESDNHESAAHHAHTARAILNTPYTTPLKRQSLMSSTTAIKQKPPDVNPLPAAVTPR